MIYAKIIGWLVFALGLILIGWTLLHTYDIFTAKVPAPNLFVFVENQVSGGGQTDIQVQMESIIKSQLGKIIPPEFISKILDLTVWSILAFLLIYGGMQISSLGIKLLKG